MFEEFFLPGLNPVYFILSLLGVFSIHLERHLRVGTRGFPSMGQPVVFSVAHMGQHHVRDPGVSSLSHDQQIR